MFLPMGFLVGPDGQSQPVVAQAVFVRVPSYLCCHLELITDPLLENLDSKLIGNLLDRKWIILCHLVFEKKTACGTGWNEHSHPPGKASSTDPLSHHRN